MRSRWIFSRTGDSSFGDFAVLAFLCVQACDGILTYVGQAALGPGIEGNPLVASMMAMMGAGPALAGVKLMASSLGIVLHLFGAHRLLALLTAIYVVAAVVPWTAVLWLGVR